MSTKHTYRDCSVGGKIESTRTGIALPNHRSNDSKGMVVPGGTIDNSQPGHWPIREGWFWQHGILIEILALRILPAEIRDRIGCYRQESFFATPHALVYDKGNAVRSCERQVPRHVPG